MSSTRSAARTTSQVFGHNMVITQPILVVEDQKSLATFLAELIRDKWQADVHVAHTYQEAKGFLKKHRHEYLVALCDLNLPDAKTGEIIDLMNRAKVRSIALTGSFGKDIKTSLAEKNVVDYVQKDSVNAYDYIVDLVGHLYRNKFISALVVEDSKSAQALLVQMLELQNFNVLVANNGDEALAAIKKVPNIRLMLTDYNMPKMSGIELTVEVRKKITRNQLTIIGLSGSGDCDLGAMFIKHGANDFLLKPYSYEELLCRVNQNMELLEYIELIEEIAIRDFLTKLYNRRYYFQQGSALLAKAIQNAEPTAVAMIDIDFFKKLNDEYGHDCGDAALIYFSNILTEQLGAHLIARIGGEEFALLFSNTSLGDAHQQLERYRLKLNESSFEWQGSEMVITASMGLADATTNNIDEVLNQADIKLYDAKQNGRNIVVI